MKTMRYPGLSGGWPHRASFGADLADYEAAHAKHEEMGCICYENPGMGIYFIADPDGYWLEIVPAK